MSPKTVMKNQKALHEIFLKTQYQCETYFKIYAPLFLFFFREYFNPQVRVNKMAQKITLSVITLVLQHQSQVFKFSYFRHAPRQKSSPGSYHHPPGRGKLLIYPPNSIFFKNLFPPSRNGGGNYIRIK